MITVGPRNASRILVCSARRTTSRSSHPSASLQMKRSRQQCQVTKQRYGDTSVGLRQHVLNERPPQPPQDGIIVYGMCLEGARIDGATGDTGLLADPLPKQPLPSLPESWLESIAKGDKPSRASDYTCPLYKTVHRRRVLSTTWPQYQFCVQSGASVRPHSQKR
jgi:hypothetical protein